MSVVVITPPGPLLDLAVVKQHLRVDSTAEDDLITLYMASAQAALDGPFGFLERCIGVQTLELRLNGFRTPIWGWGMNQTGLFWGSWTDYSSYFGAGVPLGGIDLPFPSLISVTSVTYEDTTGATITLPSANYLASGDGLFPAYQQVFPTGRWEPAAVKIRYQAGYATVPASIKLAMLYMIADAYNQRETAITGRSVGAVEVPMTMRAEDLLRPFRVWAG